MSKFELTRLLKSSCLNVRNFAASFSELLNKCECLKIAWNRNIGVILFKWNSKFIFTYQGQIQKKVDVGIPISGALRCPN